MFFFQRNKGCGTRDKLNTISQLQDIKFKFGFGPFHNRTFHTFITLCHFYFRSGFKHNLSSQIGVECHAELFIPIGGEAFPPSMWRDCPPCGRRAMGLFERTHLPDQSPSALCCGPIRGLHCNSLIVSTIFRSSRSQRGPLPP
jgi:hypothetical protein